MSEEADVRSMQELTMKVSEVKLEWEQFTAETVIMMTRKETLQSFL